MSNNSDKGEDWTNVFKDLIPSSLAKPIALPDLLAQETSEIPWLIENFITEDGIVILSGDPSSYKTFLILQIALCVANANPLFEKFKCVQKNVLIISEEDSGRRLAQRFTMIGADDEVNIFLLIYTGFKIDNESHINHIISIIKEHNIGLVCIDSFRRVLTGDENDSTAVNKVFNALRKLSAINVAVLLTHHHRKKNDEWGDDQSKMRGSSDILAAIDSHVTVKNKGNRLFIRQTKQRDAECLDQFEVEITVDQPRIAFNYIGEIEQNRTTRDDICNIVRANTLTVLKDKLLDRQQLYSILKNQIGMSGLIKILKELELNKQISVIKGQSNKKLYTICEEAFNQNVSDTSTKVIGSQEDVSGLQ